MRGGAGAASRQAEVVVAGHTCLDLIPTFPASALGLHDLLVPGKLIDVGRLVAATGGAVPNTGVALHRLGIGARLVGKLGDDAVARILLQILEGHDPSLADGMVVAEGSASSYTIVISPPGLDRIFLHHPGPNDTFGAEDVTDEHLAGAKLFHFGYPPLMRRMYADGGQELSALLRRVKERGLTSSLDMALPDPASEAGRADWPSVLQRSLPFVDVFLPSFEEILFMLDRPRFGAMSAAGGDLPARADGSLLRELAERLLGMGGAVITFKLGGQGLYVRTTAEEARLRAMGACAPGDIAAWRDRELLSPCFQVEVAGTTGSGDCTIAGFLTALLRGLGPEEAATAGVAVGACNVERPDASSGVPSWQQVQERIRSGWPRRPASVALPRWRHDGASGLWHGPADRAAG
jgi:sugar/nucleoside kinase (ribokinase family)